MKKIYKSILVIILGLLSFNTFGQIVANDDTFRVVFGTSSSIGGDFLLNDTLNGAALNISQVNVTLIATTNPGISISGSNIAIAANMTPGTYSLVYAICDISNPANCDIGTVTIMTQIIANDDNLFAYQCFGGFENFNVLFNNGNGIDTYNGAQVRVESFSVTEPANVSIEIVENPYPWITLNIANGSIVVDSFAPGGAFTLSYKIIDLTNSNNWDIGYVTVEIFPAYLNANNDNFGDYNNLIASTTPSILDNDSICGYPLDEFNSTINYSSPPQAGLTYNSNGTISIAAGTSPGTYLVNYQVFSYLFGLNGYGDATAYINVTGDSSVVANYDDFGTIPNYPGSTTQSVLANDTLNSVIINNPSSVILTAINNPTGFTINSNGNIVIASSVLEGTYNIPYKICNASIPGDCSVNYAYVVVLKNRVLGKVQYDADNNGCDASDYLVNDLNIRNVNGSNVYNTFTGYLAPFGHYYVIGDFGTNTVSVQGLPSYFTVSPVNQVYNFTTPGTTSGGDFCITKNADVDDLEIVLIPLRNIVPGFPVLYDIWYKNNGSTTLSGQTTIQFDNSKMTFLSSLPMPTTTNLNSMSFSYSNLAPFESRVVRNVKFQIEIPPTVDLGNILTFNSNIIPVVNDATPLNNENIFVQTAVNSQDPNDIIVHQGSEITLDKASEYLHYTIRFQNIGDSNAVNIKIENDLDPKLDWSTFQLINASHNCRVKNKNNKNEYLFEGINLSGTLNEPLSHGYLTYKIKPVSTIAVGDVISNDANIFFDFNAPINTNIVTTTIIDNLSNENFTFNNFKLFPNPVKNSLTISNASPIETIEISSILGQKMISKKVNDIQTEIDLSQLSNGIYFVKVTSQGSEKTIKIIKE